MSIDRELIAKQQNEARNALIEARMLEEQKCAAFAKAVASMDTVEVFGNTYIPPEISLRAFCPEAYSDDPNPTVYKEQFQKMYDVLKPLNDKLIEYQQASYELHQQFKQMSAQSK